MHGSIMRLCAIGRYRNTIVHAATETRCPADQPLYGRPALQSLIRERDPLPSPSPQEEIFRDLNIFKGEVVVLLVTIKDVEAWAVLSYMSPPESNGQPLYAENRTTNLYNPMRKTVLTLGMFGGHKTALLWAKVGEDSRAEIENALELVPNVQLIATVGVAYGVDSKKTLLGDVLVSTTIDGIGNIRWEDGNLIFEEGDNRYTRIEQRALDVFATEVDDWVAITNFNVTTCGRQPKVYTDAIIGLPWFINDVKIFSQVVANSPAAIGGEMEGQVIASIHNDLLDLNPPQQIDVIVIKGVAEFAGQGYGSCDWYLTASKAAAGYMDFKLTQTRNQICELFPWNISVLIQLKLFGC